MDINGDAIYGAKSRSTRLALKGRWSSCYEHWFNANLNITIGYQGPCEEIIGAECAYHFFGPSSRNGIKELRFKEVYEMLLHSRQGSH